MGEIGKKGLPVVGIIFLALAAFKFLQGDDWVVWLILGFLFGGFGVFARNKSGGNG
ncbi:hypothetical protein U4960_08760 [Altererythrobacter sp. H2]|uniref:hypothetical protein n=1 Tax=Altererythrobacter sp. H2 TaxID=3108391 RepID=UPI002B4BE6CE|nr:hypothetical protein [Altererythrobacter sp. H2]WRK94393.1 hypothetical protein U4960_08760 [Altererythrobacter sp. H2]